MLLHLIRHGQTDSNVNHLLDTAHPGAPLNRTGLGQAETLVQRLAGAEIEAVFSSDLVRAVQTATPLAAARGLEVVQDRRFREIPAGVEEMNPEWDRYTRMLLRWIEDMEHTIEGGESGNQVLARFDAGVAEIASVHRSAVIVSHGAMLGVWLTMRGGVDPSVVGHLDNTAVIVLDGHPGSGWEIISLAEL